MKLPFDLHELWDLNIHIYWKNKKGVYLGCNEYMAKNLTLPSNKAIVGLKDEETLVSDKALIFQHQDQEVLKSKQTQVFIDSGKYESGNFTFITIKQPITHSSKSPDAVLGISVPINQADFGLVVSKIGIKNLCQFANIENQLVSALKYSKNSLMFGKLSKREKQCLFFLVRGASSRIIAEKLQLSKRTVEDYIENAKNKLGCFNKGELIQLTLEHYGLGELFCE